MSQLNAKLGLMDDSDYLRLLTIAAEQANAFLSNARKWERERWVCQRLLQGLNVPYRADEFAPAGSRRTYCFAMPISRCFSCSTRASPQ